MLTKLKSVETRMVYDEKVVRFTCEMPYRAFSNAAIDEEDAMDFLNSRVGSEISVSIAAFEKGQSRLDD